MYSNCLYNFEAFANKKKIPIAPQNFFLPMSKPYILHFTLYITLTLYFVLCLIVYSYTIAIAIANKYNSH
jgi:hypothetical protein